MAAGNSIAASKPYRSPAERTSGPFEAYEVKEALRTLTDAEKIKRNKALLRACRIEAKKQVDAAQAAAKSIQGGK
jgi:lipopolysaccharide export system protein LptA